MTPNAATHPRAHLRIVREMLTPPVHLLREDATLAELIDTFARDATSQTAYLVTPSRRLVGSVPFRDLRRALHLRHGARFPGLAGLIQRAWHGAVEAAGDLAKQECGVTLDTPIRDALFHMDLRRLSDLPILDQRGTLTLELTHGAHAKLLANLAPGNAAPAVNIRSKIDSTRHSVAR